MPRLRYVKTFLSRTFGLPSPVDIKGQLLRFIAFRKHPTSILLGKFPHLRPSHLGRRECFLLGISGVRVYVRRPNGIPVTIL